MHRTLKKTAKRVLVGAVFVAAAYYFPVPVGLFVFCGLWDVSRNRGLDPGVLRQYFFRNGIGTWAASPLNILLDLLALPYTNKGVYRLSDLPPEYRAELSGLVKTAGSLQLEKRLEARMGDLPRAMFFFKWYGRDMDAVIDVPEFHRDFKFVRTIGVSAFRKKESTSRHFGPFRASLRVLYCLTDIKDPSAYIKVGPVEHRWNEDKLFIFDDTLLHQSFNETDQPRYVMFVDIIRPSYLPFVFDLSMSAIRFFFNGINGVFYKNWKLIKN